MNNVISSPSLHLVDSLAFLQLPKDRGPGPKSGLSWDFACLGLSQTSVGSWPGPLGWGWKRSQLLMEPARTRGGGGGGVCSHSPPQSPGWSPWPVTVDICLISDGPSSPIVQGWSQERPAGSLWADARLLLRLLSPRPSLLTPTSDTRANASPQKPLDLKQLKQRAAAIPPIVSAQTLPCRTPGLLPRKAAAPVPPILHLCFRKAVGQGGCAAPGGGGSTCSLALPTFPAASCFLEKSPRR